MLKTYSIDILRCWCVCSIGAMTFKSEIIFCTGGRKKKGIFTFFTVNWASKKGSFIKWYLRIWGVDVMNSYSSFNTSKGKSSRFVHFVFKNSNTAMLNLRKTQRILERGPRARFCFPRRRITLYTSMQSKAKPQARTRDTPNSVEKSEVQYLCF